MINRLNNPEYQKLIDSFEQTMKQSKSKHKELYDYEYELVDLIISDAMAAIDALQCFNSYEDRGDDRGFRVQYRNFTLDRK